MNGDLIALLIGIAVGLLTILTALSKIVYNYARLSSKVTENEKKDEQAHARYEKKFDDLLGSRNEHETKLAEFDLSIESIGKTVNRLESKIDYLIEKEGNR